MKNKNPWIITYSGKKWYITDPRPRDVNIADVAHGLTLTCRYGGQCQRFYSVAQHSLYVKQALHEKYPTDYLLQLHGLLHDASEALLSDVVRPLKHCLPEYLRIEKATMAVILKGLKIPPLSSDHEAKLKYADNAVLLAERRDLLVVCKYKWNLREKPVTFRILPSETFQITESRFLFEYNQLRSAL